MSERSSIKNLYQQVKALNAGVGHLALEQVFNDPKAIAVISVYEGQKPAHMVLDELYNWADENGNKELMDKIEGLEKDLSFLDKA